MSPTDRRARAYGPVTRAAMPDPEATWLHLLRHGRVDPPGVRLCRGHQDDDLSPEGRAESAALADFCATRLPRPEGVLTSDLRRTRSLAQDLAARLGVPVEEHPALREQWMGAWEGRAWEDLNREDRAGVAAYWDGYVDARAGGGESFGDLARRVLGWWDAESPRLRGRRWFVATHIGVVRVLCCASLGLGLDQALRFAPGYASHTQLGWAPAGGVLVSLGERPWAGEDRQ